MSLMLPTGGKVSQNDVKIPSFVIRCIPGRSEPRWCPENTYLDDLVDLPDTLHHMLQDLFGGKNFKAVVFLILPGPEAAASGLPAVVPISAGHNGINQLHLAELQGVVRGLIFAAVFAAFLFLVVEFVIVTLV